MAKVSSAIGPPFYSRLDTPPPSSHDPAIDSPMFTRILTPALIALSWSALAVQLWLTLRYWQSHGLGLGASLVKYLSYFTILTNGLAALSLTVPAVSPASKPGRFFASPSVRGGIAASIFLVAIIYEGFLRRRWNPQGMQFAMDILLHDVIPVLYLVLWGLPKRSKPLPWSCVVIWTIYPTVYLAWVLIVGAISGMYPYPFLNISKLGYAAVLGNAIGVQLGFAAICLVLLGTDRILARRRRNP